MGAGLGRRARPVGKAHSSAGAGAGLQHQGLQAGNRQQAARQATGHKPVSAAAARPHIRSCPRPIAAPVARFPAERHPIWLRLAEWLRCDK
jgi:hypothetical protein